MLWQVSGSMYFDLLERRNFFWSKIYAWIEKGYLSISNTVGFIFPRYLKNYEEMDPPEGPYLLEWLLWVEQEADKQSMEQYYYNHVEEEINKSLPGFLAGHKCRHDQGLPCTDLIINSWDGE